MLAAGLRRSRRQRQASQAQYPATGWTTDGAHGCNLGCGSPPCSIVREHRPTTLVQLEPIRTAATRAANAVGLLCGPHPCRLLRTLLPSRRIGTDRCGQIWNIDPAHDRRRTVLDDVPTPTDQKVVAPACPMRWSTESCDGHSWNGKHSLPATTAPGSCSCRR
jgi:hypothetical protein